MATFNKQPLPKGRATEVKIYCSTYCNHGHNVKTGRPIGHECMKIPPAALRAEMDGDFELAIKLIWSTRLKQGVR